MHKLYTTCADNVNEKQEFKKEQKQQTNKKQQESKCHTSTHN
jgi:hypothetical protein